MHIFQIQHNSDEYRQAVAVRSRVLREPLGRFYSHTDLDAENNQLHFNAVENGKIIGTVILAPHENNTVQMRQLAVLEEKRGQGIGARLVEYVEHFARQQGYKKLFLKARETAVPFYLKLDYTVIGERFIQVGLPHFRMEKAL